MGLRHDAVDYFLFLHVIVIWYSFGYSLDKNIPDIMCYDTKCWKTGKLHFKIIAFRIKIKILPTQRCRSS